MITIDSRTLQIDILLYIALSEEFDALSDELINEFGKDFTPHELCDLAITIFLGNVTSPFLTQVCRLGTVPAGKMGISRTASLTSALLSTTNAHDVVVLGIAGSLSDEIQPGDVFIPDSVNEYLANAATKGEGATWTFHTSGNHWPTSPRLLNRFQNFRQTQRESYNEWQHACAARLEPLIHGELGESMTNVGLTFRPDIRLFAGDDRKLASGPAVGKGNAFVEWLKRHVDRKLVAMEMESAGAYDAASIRTPPPRVIAIRGISDFADDRKDLIEHVAKDHFRAMSAKNALSLLLYGIKAGLFEDDRLQGLRQDHAESGRFTILDGVTWNNFAKLTSDQDLSRIADDIHRYYSYMSSFEQVCAAFLLSSSVGFHHTLFGLHSDHPVSILEKEWEEGRVVPISTGDQNLSEYIQIASVRSLIEADLKSLDVKQIPLDYEHLIIEDAVTYLGNHESLLDPTLKPEEYIFDENRLSDLKEPSATLRPDRSARFICIS